MAEQIDEQQSKPCWTTPCSALQQCAALFCPSPLCTALHYHELRCTELHHAELHSPALLSMQQGTTSRHLHCAIESVHNSPCSKGSLGLLPLQPCMPSPPHPCLSVLATGR